MQFFKSRYLAQKEANNMTGWNTKIIHIHGNGFVVQCNGTKYLRTDGYVN